MSVLLLLDAYKGVRIQLDIIILRITNVIIVYMK